MTPRDDSKTSHASADHNRRAWDARAERGERFAQPVSDEELREPLKTVDGLGWLGPSIAGRRVLCLAAGGGRQGPLYAAAGADVTVLDISPRMLAIDREVASERRLAIRTVEGSMDDLSMFAAGEFEIVIHPVSTCYVPDVQPVFREVARVLPAGGLYISQHKSPVSLQTAVKPDGVGYALTAPYYRDGPLPDVAGSRHRESGTLEYLHRWEQIFGGLCRTGFVIEDAAEPLHADAAAPPGSFGHRSRYVAPYIRIKARRTVAEPAIDAKKLWAAEL